MAQVTVFDSLVAGLSVQERRDLLLRLHESAALSSEPLLTGASLPRRPTLKPEDRAATLGFLSRIFLFVRKLFSGKTTEELFLEDDLAAIVHEVNRQSPGLMDPRGYFLLEDFRGRIAELRDAARFFYELFDRTIERDRAVFFAFLGSIEMQDIHARLILETDPVLVFRAREQGESELRQTILRAHEEILASVPEDRRRLMYRDFRGILFLKQLSGFLFDRLIGLYRPGMGPGGGLAAAIADARELLLELGDILFSLADPPSRELMEALFLFSNSEELAMPDFDAESALSGELGRANEALGRIRSFNATVPFAKILAVAAGDPGYEPRSLPGGEDWFVLYRVFWKERIEKKLEEWRAERQRQEVQDEIASFIGDSGPCSLTRVSRQGVEGGPPVRQEFALAFLDGFHRGAFLKDLNRPLKLVLVDGEFFRKDNRIEFTDAYNGLGMLGECLRCFDDKLKPEGEFGKVWRHVAAELAPAAQTRRRFQLIEQGIEEESEKLVRDTGEALKGIVRILRGILKGEAGGRYDSLANLSSIDGRANKDFIKSLGSAKDRCERALSLLAQISGYELGRAD